MLLLLLACIPLPYTSIYIHAENYRALISVIFIQHCTHMCRIFFCLYFMVCPTLSPFLYIYQQSVDIIFASYTHLVLNSHTISIHFSTHTFQHTQKKPNETHVTTSLNIRSRTICVFVCKTFFSLRMMMNSHIYKSIYMHE